MSNTISAEQALINVVMAYLPEVKTKKEYTLKQGESLWAIAKRELGSENLSNKEVRDYMLLIAKLNDLNTVEKMNGLKASEKIYLPENIEAAQKSVKSVKDKSSVGKTVENLVNILKNDKTVHVQRGLTLSADLYHVYNEKKYPSGWVSKSSPVLSFKVDKNDNIENISADDVNDICRAQYDYHIDKNGNVNFRKYPYKTVGKLTKEDKAELFNQIEEIYKKYKAK